MRFETGDIVIFRDKEYEVLDITPDNTLIIGNGNNCETEASKKEVIMKKKTYSKRGNE